MPAGAKQPDDLFEAALRERMAERAPLAARMRPKTIDDIVGQHHLLGPGAPLRALIESDRLSSIVLWGPPGTGKTTLAMVVANQTSRQFVSLSAVTAGVKDTWIEHDRDRIRKERDILLSEQNRLVRDRDDLQRKLNGARSNISRLAERRVTELFPDGPGKTMPS